MGERGRGKDSIEATIEMSLFPSGVDRLQPGELLDQYRMYVDTMEKVVSRRQVTASFFLSLNGLLLTGLGLCLRAIAPTPLAAGSGAVVSLVGAAVCVVWRRLMQYYAQLNASKFEVIHAYEKHLPSAPFCAEWVALGEGKNSRKYVSFARTERRVSSILVYLYIAACALSTVYAIIG